MSFLLDMKLTKYIFTKTLNLPIMKVHTLLIFINSSIKINIFDTYPEMIKDIYEKYFSSGCCLYFT